MSISQRDRAIQVATPLGPDVLLLSRMKVHERLSTLFEITLDLLSARSDIQLSDLLGQGVTVGAEMPTGSARYFHGIVSRFCQMGQRGQLHCYQATLVPWFWLLTRTADCRIFQQKTVPDIIKEVFRENGFSDFQDSLVGTYREWEYCVQYRETDYNFVSRLMEQEGIYYYFMHQDGKHELVLADDYASHNSVPNYEQVPYFPPEQQQRERDHIFEWSVAEQVRSGGYTLNDYDFERPKADLLVKSLVQRQHGFADFEIFDYPGEYLQASDGDKAVQHRLQEHQAEFERAYGSADACGLQTGALFVLENYPREDQNREYLLVSTTQELINNKFETDTNDQGGFTWKCDFEAMESPSPFRSPRKTPKPVVRGPQTAVVVGKSGEEIWTDKYGRVKLQFHWDRYGQSDENSSCWVRVAQVWAGKTWGAMHIPRVGQEVIVEFLEGDPDRPIVTGRVYNADEMPPYKLPDNQSQSGIKSRSTKNATAQNFNELRFEDKKGEEQIYFHAEKDFLRVVENNDTLKVGFETKDKGDQIIDIHNNQKLTIGNKQSKDGSQTIIIWKNQTETVETGDQTLKIDKGNRSVTVMKNDDLVIKSGNQTINIKAGKGTTQAAQSLELKVGASSIKIEPAAITIKSPQIKIQADATAKIQAAMTSCSGSAMLELKGGLTKIN